MGKTRSMLDDVARKFIEAQHVFFVASAPLDAAGHVNLSPKGLDTFRILGPTTVAYVDFNGSGVETIAHLKENGRIVLMFCAFQVRRIFFGSMVTAASSSRTRRNLQPLLSHFLIARTRARSSLSNSLESPTRVDTAFLFLSIKASANSSMPGRATVARRD
jgi:hypothetical protein